MVLLLRGVLDRMRALQCVRWLHLHMGHRVNLHDDPVLHEQLLPILQPRCRGAADDTNAANADAAADAGQHADADAATDANAA